jgi:beta-phosphoglucomutase
LVTAWEFTQADFTATFGRRNPEIIGSLFPGHTLEETAKLGEQKEVYYRSEAQHGVSLLPGVAELLEELNSLGFKQALGSSAPHKNLELITRITDSLKYFSAIVGSEDTTRGKPDPQVFLVAAERLGISPANCLVVEDAVAGIEAATAGGMKSIAVTFVGHHSEDKLKAAGANLVVPSMEKVSTADILRILGTN